MPPIASILGASLAIPNLQVILSTAAQTLVSVWTRCWIKGGLEQACRPCTDWHMLNTVNNGCCCCLSALWWRLQPVPQSGAARGPSSLYSSCSGESCTLTHRSVLMCSYRKREKGSRNVLPEAGLDEVEPSVREVTYGVI